MKHEIIKTENYLLAVDDSEIKEGDYHVAIRIVKTNGDKAIAFTDQEQLDAIAEIGGAKKIIAHLPLNNSPILDGVPLLPPLPSGEDDVEMEYYTELEQRREIAKNFKGQVAGRHPDMFGGNEMHHMVRGYMEAKQKYKYTEEDMRIAIRLATTSKHDAALIFFSEKEIIQSLSQPKMPIGFECQTFDTGDDKLDGTHVLGIRTTTNSQGQSVWVGKYIY